MHKIKSIKGLSDTRWSSRKDAVEAVLQSLPALILALKRILKGEINCTAKQLSDASGLLTNLTKIEFLIFLFFWKKILDDSYYLSMYLQKSNVDLCSASTLIKAFENELESIQKNYETEFVCFEKSAKELAQMC